MATVQSPNRLAPRVRIGNDVMQGQVPEALNSSLLQTLAFASRRLMGGVLLLLGLVMTSTLVLLPVGLPVVILALALIAAPGSPGLSLPSSLGLPPCCGHIDQAIRRRLPCHDARAEVP
jgi:hypothetical protein